MSTRGHGLTAAVLPHRGRDYAAGLATAACIAQLLLAPLTLVLTAALASAGHLTRWRPHWLAVPAGLGYVLAAARGFGSAAVGYYAWPQRLAAGLTSAGPHGRLLVQALRDVPAQLPLALLAASVQAGALAWLARRVRGAAAPPWRPGLLAAARRRHGMTALTAGRTVTTDGCALGIDPGTGSRARLSWSEAAPGVLACGTDQAAVLNLCLPVVSAALRRRKTVVVADLSGGRPVAAAVRGLAGPAGVPVADLAAAGSEAGQVALGRALRQHTAVLTAGDGAILGDPTGMLTSLAELGLHADALVWVHGCERAGQALPALLTAVRRAGCCVLLSTTDQAAADELAAAAAVVLVAGPSPRHALASQRPGTFAILTGARREPGLIAVPVAARFASPP